MNKLAIIGTGVIAKTLTERCRELGVESHCFSFDRNDLASKTCDVFHEINIFDIEGIVEICRKEGISGVIATTELTILPTAKVAHALGLNGNQIQNAEDITNKYQMRRKVEGVSGLCQPRYQLYTSGEYPRITEYPVIVKPIAAGGKRGVNVVNNQEELEKAIRKALPFSRVEGVLIEEYLDGGTEYSVESLSYHGKNYILQVTQKDTSGPPHCNELGHHQPAHLTPEMRAKVEQTISEMLKAAGVENGSCHTEIKIINDRIYLIEINDRFGGDHISYPLTELSTGYPYISGAIMIALNQFEGYEPTQLKGIPCGILFVTEQTAYLEPLFEKCEQYSWLYKKNKVSDEPSKLIFNDEDNTNYMIYYGEDINPSDYLP